MTTQPITENTVKAYVHPTDWPTTHIYQRDMAKMPTYLVGASQVEGGYEDVEGFVSAHIEGHVADAALNRIVFSLFMHLGVTAELEPGCSPGSDDYIRVVLGESPENAANPDGERVYVLLIGWDESTGYQDLWMDVMSEQLDGDYPDWEAEGGTFPFGTEPTNADIFRACEWITNRVHELKLTMPAKAY